MPILRVEMARPHPLPLLTTVSRLKTIVSFVRRTEGEEAALALLDELSLDPALLEDETRPLPFATWQAALTWLASRRGKEALLEMAPDVVEAENLGVFAKLFRGLSTLSEAFLRLDELPPLASARFEVVKIGPGLLRGRLSLDESKELARLAMLAELSAIPLLFGFDRGKVELREGGEFVLRYREPRLLPAVLVALASTLLAGLLFFLYEPLFASALTSVFALVSAIFALTSLRERRRLVESRAQKMRILALERGILLAELRRESAPGYLEGAVIANAYLLHERLGAGANGVIHRATRLLDQATVAMKLLRTAAADDPVAADRLSREAEALALSRHPNVVELYDHDLLDDGTAYLVLEYLEGESLASRLERDGLLAPDELAPLALSLSEALVAVHAAGVIHRDLKPSNVFLARDRPGKTQVKLLDFGVAQIEWAETRLTHLGTTVGTLGYISPEQAQGSKIDARSDLYSFGILLSECLTGRRPGERAEELPTVRDRPSGVERAATPIPPSWREVIERATAMLPEERFADARAMREAIVRAWATGLREAR